VIHPSPRGYVIRWMYAMLIAAACIAPVHAQQSPPSCSTIVPNRQSFIFGFSVAEVVVPEGLPDGAVLATTTLSVPYTCPATPSASGWSFRYWPKFTSSKTIPGDLHFTSGGWNWGVGIRVTNMNTGQQMKTDVSQGFVEWMPTVAGTAPLSGSIEFKLELVKLNDMIYNPIGGLAYGVNTPLASFRFVNNATGTYLSRTIHWKDSPIKIRSIPKSCSATMQDVQVNLDSVPASRLTAPGATAGDKAFNVGLRCSPGTNVYVTLTDLTDPGNTSDRLTLAPGSTASGVQLRLLRANGVPVGYGPDSMSPGTRNQWYVGPSGSTTGIPLTAQYIADGPVTAGSVKGRASFTLSYQ